MSITKFIKVQNISEKTTTFLFFAERPDISNIIDGSAHTVPWKILTIPPMQSGELRYKSQYCVALPSIIEENHYTIGMIGNSGASYDITGYNSWNIIHPKKGSNATAAAETPHISVTNSSGVAQQFMFGNYFENDDGIRKIKVIAYAGLLSGEIAVCVPKEILYLVRAPENIVNMSSLKIDKSSTKGLQFNFGAISSHSVTVNYRQSKNEAKFDDPSEMGVSEFNSTNTTA